MWEVMLATSEFPAGLREAVARHNVRVPRWIDGLIMFDEPRRGFYGVMIEAKSGGQTYDAAIHQLKCYRAALFVRIPGPMIVWGITEEGDARHWRDQEKPHVAANASQDLWLFSPAASIPIALA